jgi:hypothetical protein
MTTFCIVCRDPIPETRQRRAARTCSVDCQKQYRREYIRERNQRFCKACGRGLRKASSETKTAKGTLFLAQDEALHEEGGQDDDRSFADCR